MNHSHLPSVVIQVTDRFNFFVRITVLRHQVEEFAAQIRNLKNDGVNPTTITLEKSK